MLKELRFRAYRVTVVHELKEPDKGKRVAYCNWLLSAIVNGFFDHMLFFMTEEARFHLSGYVNSQNTRYWSQDNSHIVHEEPRHPEEIGVWCAVSGMRIIGIFL